MTRCRIDDLCHNIRNFIVALKGMALEIERGVEADTPADDLLSITAKLKHRCQDLEQFLSHVLGRNGPDLREMAVRIAWAYLGTPYRWGGDDPIEGLDCSGFVIEVLKSVGVLPRFGDWSADSLYTHFSGLGLEVSHPVRGGLVFFFSGPRAIHVELCLDDRLTIGASGGSARTLTLSDAATQNAYVKIRPLASHTSPARFIDPF